MLPILGWWVKTTVHFILSNKHSPLHHSNSWEFSYPCCPSQRIFPPSAIQTLVSLSGNNWSVGWSCYPACRCYLLDVFGSRTLESLSIHEGRRYITGFTLCGVSLFTMTAISVDQLLAMLLGLRYKDIVTLRHTYITLAIVWVVCLIAGLFSHLDHRITFWCSPISISSCLVISVASYTKIFRALSHHRAQIQDHAQQQPGQPNALNISTLFSSV